MEQIINTFSGKYDFLSNYFPVEVFDNDVSTDGVIICYPTVEHAFQAAKTLDFKERQKIADCRTPGLAKWAGRRASIRPDWEDVKRDIMKSYVRQKFFKHPVLRQQLLDTGNAILIEGNFWHDNTWGNCTCKKCQNINGQNYLGKILMEIREEISNDNE